MALYRPAQFVQASDNDVFDEVKSAGEEARHAGIYRCEACGHETPVQAGSRLPSHSHPLTTDDAASVRWRLIVFAEPI